MFKLILALLVSFPIGAYERNEYWRELSYLQERQRKSNHARYLERREALRQKKQNEFWDNLFKVPKKDK